jgi:hypothetical protein
MKRFACILGIAAGICGSQAFALDLDPHSKAKAIAASAPTMTPAPNASRVQIPDIHGSLDNDGRAFSGACNASSTELCYDPKSGRIVYKGTRNWMPEVSGMKAEHISVRKDRVEFRYSFR